jgi:cellulose synthase operon protein C
MKSRCVSLRVRLLAAVIVATLWGCSAKKPEDHIQAAKAALEKKDTRTATIEVKNALQFAPNTSEARFLLGKILSQDSDHVAAEVEFRKAIAAGHAPSLVVPELAKAMAQLGQHKKLVDEFSSSKLGNNEADAGLQVALASAYNAIGKPKLAEAAVRAALAASPGYPPALLAEARQAATEQRYALALDTTAAVLSKDPADPEAWALKGDILQAMGTAPEAIEAYRKSVEINPKFARGHIAILALLISQQKLNEASTQLQSLKAIAANSPRTKFLEASLAFAKKDYKQTRELTSQLLRATPNNPLILELAGSAEMQLNALGQAEIYLARAVQVAPALSRARRLLAATRLRLGQPTKALEALHGARSQADLEPEMLSVAGEAYLQSGDAKKAEEYFTKALKLDPSNPSARTALAVARLSSGHAEAAFAELQDIALTDKGTTADLALISAYLRRKEMDKALQAAGKLQAKLPNSAMAANLHGRIQLATKNPAAARKSFERSLEIDPSFFAAAANLATLDLGEKNIESAKQRFQMLLKSNAKHGPALLALAKLSADNGGSKEEVTTLLTRAVDASPTDAKPRQLLIELYLRTNDAKKALALAQSSVSALPNDPDVLETLGRVQQASGDLNQAVATFGKLSNLRPLSPGPYMRLASAHIAGKNPAAAELSLRKALEIQPNLLDAQRGLVMLSMEKKQFAEALKVAKTVQEQRPGAPYGYLMEGDIGATQKNWDAAAVAYKAGLQRIAVPELAVKLYAVLVSAGKNSDADRFASAWMKDHPKDASFRFHLGDAALAGKDLVTAERHYLAANEIQPDNPLVLNNLAWVAGQLNRSGAIHYAERANKLAPNQPDLMDTLAMLLVDQGDPVRATALLSKALELRPADPKLKLNLARAYIKSGDKVRAKAALEDLGKLGTKFSQQDEVSALLKRLQVAP